jgi:YbbR domain-containing protein
VADSDSQVPIFLDRLRNLFRPSSEEGRPNEESSPGTALAVCVLLSFVLWLSLTLQEQRMVSVDFPVEVGEQPEGRALVERPPSSVTVQLRGTGLDLIGLVFNPPSIVVEAGQEQVDVAEALKLPRASDAQVESVTPRAIDVKTEPRVEKRVPIRPRLTVRTASAHELIDEPTITPDSVTVIGAESVVEPLTAWPTDSLVLKDIRDTVRATVALEDSLTGLVQRSDDRVSVVARAGKFAEETREVTVQVTGVPAGQDLVTLQPSTIRIRYRVLFDQLFASRRSSEFFATVSYSQIRSDTTGYVEPRIHVPSDLVIRDPEAIPPRLRYYTFLSGE